MIFLAKRRDIVEVMNEVLEGISKGLPITRIMMYSSVNYAYMKKVVLLLSDRGLIKVEKDPEEMRFHYYLTTKGIYLRNLLNSLNGLLVYSYGNANDASWDPEYDAKYIEEKSRIVVKELSTKKKRSHIEIYFAILSSITNKPRTISSIANHCYINLEQATKYLKELLELDMVVEVSDLNKKKYQVTGKGMRFLDTYLRIYELVRGLD
ncbi:MAG: winged helix-turn-helix domain-containing protein [Desulfurococcaceae archaeon]